MELKTIIWVFIIIFSLTAVITLLGITNVIKGIKEKYLNKLFYTLIIEVVIAVIAVFKGVDFNDQSISIYSISERADITQEFNSDEKLADYLVEQLKNSTKIPTLEQKTLELKEQLNDSKEEKTTLLARLDSCGETLSQSEKSFYSIIGKLRTEIINYSGYINLKYKASEKVEVYRLLAEIFEILGELKEGEENNIEALQKQYKQFELRHGLYQEGKLFISEYKTSVMIREYLNKIYPVE